MKDGKDMKKATAIIVLAVIVFMLIACAPGRDPGAVAGIETIYTSDTVKIEREGNKTRVFDLEGNAQYSFQVKRTRQPKGAAEAVKTATVNVDTSTVKIETVHGLIVVTIKAEGKILYIK